MVLYENVLTALVLLMLTVLAYCKFSNKGIGEMITEIKEAIAGGTDE